MKHPKVFSGLLLLAALAAGCTTTTPTTTTAAKPGAGTLSGTITYREKIALPPGAKVGLYLIENTRVDQPVKMLTDKVFTPQGQVPIAWSLDYNPSQISPANRYSVGARILVNGQLWMDTQAQHLVITGGAPTSGIEIITQPVR